MSKPVDSLERKIRSRPGAAERIDARTIVMRSIGVVRRVGQRSLGKPR